MGGANLPPHIFRQGNASRKETRTNNDCEGWRRRTIHCAMEIMIDQPMYCLNPIIFSEAEKLQLQKPMVEDGSLQRLQRRNVRDRQRQYAVLWGQFEEGHLTDIQLLREIAKTFGPSRLWDRINDA